MKVKLSHASISMTINDRHFEAEGEAEDVFKKFKEFLDTTIADAASIFTLPEPRANVTSLKHTRRVLQHPQRAVEGAKR